MKPLLHLLKLEGVPILQQLQWEEALLRADGRNWCIFNRGSPPAIVMGISGQFDQLINRKKLECCPIPIIRRFSGGGTVVVDEETLFMTFILQSDALPIHPFPRAIMEWTAETLYTPLFHDLPFRLRENDYVFGEKKWGGNAQSILKGRWLHHSSLLWDYRVDLMDYLLTPPKMPDYRQGRSHADFLCRLRDYRPCPKQLQDQITDLLLIHFELVEKKEESVTAIAEQAHRKVTQLHIPASS